jgi:hypothetical protein
MEIKTIEKNKKKKYEGEHSRSNKKIGGNTREKQNKN